MITALEVDIITKLVLAAFLGGAVGFERELHHHPAGIRTYALVCLGSALFTLLSILYSGDGLSPLYLAGGIVTGVGFIAAGIVFRADNSVHGLTTAAAIWVMASIGVAVGVGMYYAAVVTTVIIIVILGPLRKVEIEKMDARDDYKKKR
jgi:putative Mg2+ transporter-C (MgtC) family protein